MTKRQEATTAPVPLEDYIKQFDEVFSKLNQRDGFRRYLEGLLLPTERNKTLTGLVNTEPDVGAKPPRAQGPQREECQLTIKQSRRRTGSRRLACLDSFLNPCYGSGGICYLEH